MYAYSTVTKCRSLNRQPGAASYIPPSLLGHPDRLLTSRLPVRLLSFSTPAEKAGGEVVEAACVIELPFLKGRDKIPDTPLFVLVEKEGL